jgi:hypothetical protein
VNLEGDDRQVVVRLGARDKAGDLARQVFEYLQRFSKWLSQRRSSATAF